MIIPLPDLSTVLRAAIRTSTGVRLYAGAVITRAELPLEDLGTQPAWIDPRRYTATMQDLLALAAGGQNALLAAAGARLASGLSLPPIVEQHAGGNVVVFGQDRVVMCAEMYGTQKIPVVHVRNYAYRLPPLQYWPKAAGASIADYDANTFIQRDDGEQRLIVSFH